MKKETVRQIGTSIKQHVQMEYEGGLDNQAFARAYCAVSDPNNPESLKTFWLTNREDTRGVRVHRDFTGSGAYHTIGSRTTLTTDGQPVYKNTKLGEILTKFVSGAHSYIAPGRLKRPVTITVDILNRATYQPHAGDPREVEIRIAADKSTFRFQRLSDLLYAAQHDEDEKRKKEAELRRLEEEQARLAKELEEKKAKEEKERLEATQRQKEEEERLRKEEIERIEALRRQNEEEKRQRIEEIERLEQSIAKTIEEEKAVRAFMRKNVMLRSQHLLDEYQEDAKRSHIYDGVPIVIDGGPGTGKTTTVIQRLKFLLSYQALDEYEAPLTKEKIDELTDENEVNSHWLFFSPTEMLLQYLRENMREEGLDAKDTNTRTVAKFRAKVMREYLLFDTSKDGPFRNFRGPGVEETLILDAKAVIKDFERFIIEYCNKIFSQRAALKTSDHIWHQDALRIKSLCSKGGIKDIDALMRLFNSLQDNEKSRVKTWSDRLKEDLNSSAIVLKRLVSKDETAVELLKMLFEKWRKDRLGIEETDDEDAIIDDDEDAEETTLSRQEFDAQLFSELKKLIKQLGLKKHDKTIKINKRNQELLEIVSTFIDEEDLKIEHIGSIALFVRNYASLCRGIESNILGVIPKLYKAYRKTKLGGTLYANSLLKYLVSKDNNKLLHPDEQNLLIGFINELLHSIYKKSHIRFDSLKNKYAKAFKKNVKYVIGVDEATDYSLLDYYFMISFRHYAFHSITLCGDIMQGLNDNGIKDWQELKDFGMPNLEVKSLNVSYRQLPTLLNLARELYHDDIGSYPSYTSDIKETGKEPKPLLFISDDEEEKIRWISDCIVEIIDAYKELPSVAIFVGDNVDIPDFIEKIYDYGRISDIDVVDCSGDRQLQNKEMIRIFRVSEVKGMEFEAAFFYDIDDALMDHDEDLMRRFLYVGISRATSHLAATMKYDGGQDFIKYFEIENPSWRD